MEEILASIRKIISDDDARPAVAPKPDQAAAPVPVQDDIDSILDEFEAAAPEPEVLELTEAMAAPSDQLDGTDLDFIDAAPFPQSGDDHLELEPAPTLRSEARPFPAADPLPSRAAPAAARFDDRLLSNATDSAISAAFGSLTHTILSQNARTLDDLVQDMLRPMLKSWLDDNLPAVVERLVRAEIERVSRGGR